MQRGLAISTLILLTLILSAVVQAYFSYVFIDAFRFTGRKAINEILDLMGLKDGDHLVDLGSGDGRFVIEAAKRARINAVGYEIVPFLVWYGKLASFLTLFTGKTKGKTSQYTDSYLEVDLQIFNKFFCATRPELIPMLLRKLRIEADDNAKIYIYRNLLPDITPQERHKLSNGELLYVYTGSSLKESAIAATATDSMTETA